MGKRKRCWEVVWRGDVLNGMVDGSGGEKRNGKLGRSIG